MFEKVGKENLLRLVKALLIAAIGILVLNLLLTDTGSRKQILDDNGGSEERLCSILSSIEGAGSVEVMVEYDYRDQVKGVIVLAEGGGNSVVKKQLTDGVATLYSIPVSSVIVFEKQAAEN